jgi:cellulose synthase/poly-beta-1,6-N-acetylglucosamine synthase-like glycosyltransferase
MGRGAPVLPLAFHRDGRGIHEMRPFVTVVLPIRNEAAYIEQSLGVLLAQDYPPDRMEILVVDGRSDDGTRDIVERILARGPSAAVRVLDNPGRIVPVAINLALDQARGDVIVRVDGHAVVAADYVRACVDSLRAHEADCVGGCMVARGRVPFGEAVALATSHPLGVGGSRFHYASRVMETDSVYMGAWRRDVFAWAGEFDEEMACNEDDEFSYRLRAKGGRIVLDPSIRSVYYNRSSARTLWRQYFRYGLWKVRVAQKVPRQMRPRHVIPFGFVLALAGGGLLSSMLTSVWWLWLAMIGTYAAAALGTSVTLARRGGWHLYPRLPIVFFILHAAYGTGFAVGLVRFARHWRSSREPRR